MTQAAGGWAKALAVYLQPRVLSMLFLGFSSGLPFILLFSTLSAWLRQIGISRATIGMLSWVGIVYSLKLLWAPVVDRVGLPWLDRLLGRRRSWMLVAQIGVAIGLANIAISDPAANVSHLAICTMFVAFCSATQDIAMDAWRIESAPPDMQGAMAASYQLGYRAAMAVASAGPLYLAARIGWGHSYWVMAALVGVGMVTTLLIREPDRRTVEDAILREQRVLDWLETTGHWPHAVRQAGAWFVGAIVCPLVDFFARYGIALGLLILAFVGSYRLTDFTMGVMANPLYIDLHFTNDQVAFAKFYGLFISIVGVIVGGTAVTRLGRTRALVLGSVMIIGSNICYALFARLGQANMFGLLATISIDNLAIGVHGTVLIAFLSGLTSARYTATQYALFSSIYALPGKLLMGTSGFVVNAIGYPPFFLYTASLSLIGLALLYWLVRNPALREPVLDEPRPAA
jgi:MFS transporter, PAT family, beta-lactamase induction signal transducer AmpG